MRNKFQEEVELYRDIVIADMKDTYRNLTLKVLYMMEWAFTRCSQARYYMKVDDDVFFNVPLVLDFIASIQVQSYQAFSMKCLQEIFQMVFKGK